MKNVIALTILPAFLFGCEIELIGIPEFPTEEDADETTEETSDEAADEAADETSDETSDETTEETSDETTEETSDETTEETSDETSDEDMDGGPNTMSMRGPTGEGYGFVASGGAHDLAGLSNSYYNVTTGECVEGTGYAFQNFATNTNGGGYGLEITDNFSNLQKQLRSNGFGPGDVTVSFDQLSLGDDVNGEDWGWDGSSEWRVYGNYDNSKVYIEVAGDPMLVGTMSPIYVELDHNDPDSCSDDAIRGISERIYDLAIDPAAPAVNQMVGEAMLDDLQDEGLWMSVDNTNSPIVRTKGEFSASYAAIGTGVMPF